LGDCTFFKSRAASCRARWGDLRGRNADRIRASPRHAHRRGLGKTVARCNDTPGFIVNRVARPFYLESFRILEDGYASVDEVDKSMKELGSFKMGPFELTDLIGHDVNAATTQSVWEQLGKPARLRPSKIQTQLVKDGKLGRKTGRGCYNHELEPPVPAVQITRRSLALTDRLHEAVDQFRGPRHRSNRLSAREIRVRARAGLDHQ
jgi:3-hydroxyacyl-CoA dehydrogenase